MLADFSVLNIGHGLHEALDEAQTVGHRCDGVIAAVEGDFRNGSQQAAIADSEETHQLSREREREKLGLAHIYIFVSLSVFNGIINA